MEIRHLRYFIAVAEVGSITGAAARLHITQPALSRQLHDLEAELGVKLIERVGRGIRISAAGERLLSRSRDVLRSVARLKADAEDVSGGAVRDLRLIAPAQAIESFLAEALSKFQNDFPDLSIKIIEAPSGEVQDLLERGEAELAVAAVPVGPQMRNRTIARGVIHVAMREDDPLAAKGRVDLEDLQDSPVLLMRTGTLTRKIFDSACHLNQISPQIRYESSSPHSLAALAANGFGRAIMPVTASLTVEGVTASPLYASGSRLAVDLAVLWHPGFHPSQQAIELMDRIEVAAQSTNFMKPVDL